QDFKEKAAAIAKKVEVSDDEARKAFDEGEKKRNEALGKQIDALNGEKRRFTSGLLATDKSEPVPATRILYQGDVKAEREAVVPGFISVLDPNPAEVQRPINPKASGRRSALAEWITSPENPLTSRVVVNRAWLSCFGRGLVATPNDFGLAG